jgi:hypothetical protein
MLPAPPGFGQGHRRKSARLVTAEIRSVTVGVEVFRPGGGKPQPCGCAAVTASAGSLIRMEDGDQCEVDSCVNQPRTRSTPGRRAGPTAAAGASVPRRTLASSPGAYTRFNPPVVNASDDISRPGTAHAAHRRQTEGSEGFPAPPTPVAGRADLRLAHCPPPPGPRLRTRPRHVGGHDPLGRHQTR